MKRVLRLVVLLVASCGGHRDAPNTVIGTMSIGGSAVTATCELEPADPSPTLTLTTSKGRVRVVAHAKDNAYDMFFDGKPMSCQPKVDGSSGRDSSAGGPEFSWWKGKINFDCKAAEVAVTADLTLDCGR